MQVTIPEETLNINYNLYFTVSLLQTQPAHELLLSWANSPQSVCCCYILVNISAIIWLGTLRTWQCKQGLRSTLCSTEPNRKQSDPPVPTPQPQAVKGEHFGRSLSKLWLWCLQWCRARGASWRGRRVCYLLPSILHGCLLCSALQWQVWATAAGWWRDRRLRSSSAALSLIIFPSHYLSPSLCSSPLNPFPFLCWCPFNHLHFAPSPLPALCLNLFVPRTSYLALFPSHKNESAHGFSWRFSGNTHTQAGFVVAMSQGQSVLFQMHRWESPNKFNRADCCISP